MGHLVVRRRLQLDWRRWLTGRVIGPLDAGCAALPGRPDPRRPRQPDGRIAEDIRVMTEAAVDLASTLFYCLLLLVTSSASFGRCPAGSPVAGIAFRATWSCWPSCMPASGAVAFVLGRPLVRTTDCAPDRRRQTSATIWCGRRESAERSRSPVPKPRSAAA
jgi:putative ATP-binding cassette transporter